MRPLLTSQELFGVGSSTNVLPVSDGWSSSGMGSSIDSSKLKVPYSMPSTNIEYVKVLPKTCLSENNIKDKNILTIDIQVQQYLKCENIISTSKKYN